jgi:metallo-beta-lactamase family protein
MRIEISFLGAAKNVTGSRHLVSANGTRLLVDCGFYQERQFRDRNWDEFPVQAVGIDAVLLTHAHLDHCGLLPKLVREGFRGRIYCTAATAEIAKIILLDSAHIQKEDAAYKAKRHKKEGRKGKYPEKALYTAEDAEACFDLFSPVAYRQSFEIGDSVEATLYDAGHVLGSSIIRVKVRQGGDERIILFSGDIGRPDRPIVCDPTVFDKADYVLIESTYGDRVHQIRESIEKIMGRIISETVDAGGNVIIPSFALERSQELLYYINKLQMAGQIPVLKMFLDSPMAAGITKVFQGHPELFDKQMRSLVRQNHSPFELANLVVTSLTEQSKSINDIREPIIVIAGSGMCTGGRIKHHLVNNISGSENTIMFVGYQAMGTLGRRVLDGVEEVRIHGQQYPVRARIERVAGFSAHADKRELLNWLKELEAAPRGVFVVHGESKSAERFGDYVRQQTGWTVAVPGYRDSFILD